jgi:three-Cys-motif partner protein
MPKSDRDPDKWRSRQNTRVKHDILFEYLKGFISVLSAGNRAEPLRVLHYVDSRAGRGWYEGGEPGSPIVSMRVGQELHEYLDQYRDDPVYLECYNVEYDPENFDSLEREIEAVGDKYPSVGVRNFFGPFEDHSDEILSLITSGEPTFVFIDPFGYLGVELQEVLRFLQRPRSEVFVTFMSDLIGRYMTDPNRDEAMKKVFDTDEWRMLIALQGTTQQTAAVELYARQLMKRAREKGKRVYVFPISVAYENRPGDIYHLVHISQHPKARVVMEDAVNRVKGTSVEEQLFIAPEVEGYAVEALRRVRSGRMTALDLAGEVWQGSLYASWKNDIKGAIRNLEANGEVEVRAHNGRNRTKGGIEEKDVVSLKSGRYGAIG